MDSGRSKPEGFGRRITSLVKFFRHRSVANFPYLPLAAGTKQIRLLTILPGERKDALICTISHEDLGTERHRAYETISYCWGNRNRRRVITINDIAVSVPASSEAALRSVRLRFKARTV
ncbi:hypothetical protein M011DRAFT_120349 [Sporormia fimetaria CBS 119925]|uniref:Uncharacterized protein n=1 Tax=Sporormia fimetaria CBS 119925 TaxID=1340428 RepID=A0A6A6V6U5_9PLEO|nr:hypothetical protein M011DRAFT_120349 [Sporormia fimetaria CBS 119925]